MERFQRVVRREGVEGTAHEAQDCVEASREAPTEMVGPLHQAVVVADAGVEEHPMEELGAPVQPKAVGITTLDGYR